MKCNTRYLLPLTFAVLAACSGKQVVYKPSEGSAEITAGEHILTGNTGWRMINTPTPIRSAL